VESAEHHGNRKSQPAAQLALAIGDVVLCILDVTEDPNATAIESFARLCQSKFSRRAMNELGTEAALQCR